MQERGLYSAISPRRRNVAINLKPFTRLKLAAFATATHYPYLGHSAPNCRSSRKEPIMPIIRMPPVIRASRPRGGSWFIHPIAVADMCQMTHAFRSSIAVLFVVAGMAAAQPSMPPVPSAPAKVIDVQTLTGPTQPPTINQPDVQIVPNSTQPSTSPTATKTDAQTTTPSAGPDMPSPVSWNFGRTDNSYEMWLGTNFMLDWLKHGSVPIPLVTTGSPVDLVPGAIGQPHTSVVVGDSSVNAQGFTGLQFTLGAWLNREQTFGLEGSYFFLANRSVQQNVITSGQPNSPVLAVPYFDVSGVNAPNGLPGETRFSVFGNGSAGPLLGPNGPIIAGTAGSFTQTLTTGLEGAEFNALYELHQVGGWHFDVVGGFRWLQLIEELDLDVETAGVNPSVQNQNQFFNSIDKFHSVNNFYGGQLGGRIGYPLAAGTSTPQLRWHWE